VSVRVLPGSRERGRHEAYHCAALCVLGLVPECVRIDFPHDGAAGSVDLDWGDGVDRASARSVLIAILLGGMTNGLQGWNWPIDPDCVPRGARRDAEQARHLAEYLGFDHAGWLHVIREANQLARSYEFRRLVVAITDALERVELLTAEDLRSLMASVEEAVLCNT
jgi:hypothetical protein